MTKQYQLTSLETITNETNKSAFSFDYLLNQISSIKLLTHKFLLSIINNIQISVKDVHIRYEDFVSGPPGFCFGFTLEELTVYRDNVSLSTVDMKTATATTTSSASPLPASSVAASASLSSSSSRQVHLAGPEVIYKDMVMHHVAVYMQRIRPSNTSSNMCAWSYTDILARHNDTELRSHKQTKHNAQDSTFKAEKKIEADKRTEIVTLMIDSISRREDSFDARPLHTYLLKPSNSYTYLDMKFDLTKKDIQVI